MKHLVKNQIHLFLVIGLLTIKSMYAQQETFDITNYSPPENWDKYFKEDAYVSYTTTNKEKDSYCRITVYNSIASKGSINEDFESEWEELVVKKYKLSDLLNEVDVQEFGEWETKTKVGTFTFNKKDNNNIILNTSKVFDKVVSILIIYNNPDYETTLVDFLSGVRFKKDFTKDSIITENSNNKIQLTGKWARSVSLSYNVGGMNSGYEKSIYEFKSDGSYSFTQRIWGMTAKYIYIVKEIGAFKIEDNQFTVTPQKSIIESWEHDGDSLIKLATSQKRIIEETIYKFAIKYDESMKDWDLILQANKETLRDGKFSGVQPYPNGWIYSKRFTDYDLTASRIF